MFPEGYPQLGLPLRVSPLARGRQVLASCCRDGRSFRVFSADPRTSTRRTDSRERSSRPSSTREPSLYIVRRLLIISITGKKIAMLGWAFKKDTGDSECSWSLDQADSQPENPPLLPSPTTSYPRRHESTSTTLRSPSPRSGST